MKYLLLFNLFFVIVLGRSSSLSAQEDTADYKRVNVVVGGTAWIVKSIDDFTCGFEIEARAKLLSGKNNASVRKFEPVLHIKKGSLSLVFTLESMWDEAESLVDGVQLVHEDGKVVLLCEVNNKVTRVTLSEAGYLKLRKSAKEAFRVASDMNRALPDLVKIFEDAINEAEPRVGP